MERFLVVTVPVADLLKRPGDDPDSLLETQLLYNETLKYRDERQGWYYVEAMEQRKGPEVSGYPGWVEIAAVRSVDVQPAYNAVVCKEKTAVVVEASDSEVRTPLTVCFGTRLRVEEGRAGDLLRTITADGRPGWVKRADINDMGSVSNVAALRRRIAETAGLFPGSPYLWGGRSISRTGAKVLNGVDCSGLTNLVYRVNDLDIPRDAHDQWLAATRITRGQLKPADLLFVSSEASQDRVIHVMLYLGGEQFMEAWKTGKAVAVTTFKDKFGLTLDEIAEQGFVVAKKRIYLGSFLFSGDVNE